MQRYIVTVLAAITALLDGGHIAALFRPEWVVLIAALATAVTAFFTALASHQEESERELIEQARQQSPKKGD